MDKFADRGKKARDGLISEFLADPSKFKADEEDAARSDPLVAEVNDNEEINEDAARKTDLAGGDKRDEEEILKDKQNAKKPGTSTLKSSPALRQYSLFGRDSAF